MANLAITLKAQKTNVFGPSPSTKWLQFSWGTGTWGMKAAGAAGAPGIYLGLSRRWTGSNGLGVSSPASALFKNVGKHWTGSNKITPSYQNTGKYLTDSHGFYYVFKGTNPNIEQEPINFSYSNICSPVSGFTTYPAHTTSWVTSATY